MTARIPFTRTSFGPALAGPAAAPERVLAGLERGLEAAWDPRAPLLRRLRLLASCGRGVDALFQIQIPAVRGRDAAARQRELSAGAARLSDEAYRLLAAELLPALRRRGVELVAWAELEPGERAALARSFASEISPLLTPLTVDATHPFPGVASLALNLAVLVCEPEARGERYVGIEIPPALPRFVTVGASGRRLGIESLIGSQLDALLPGLEVVCCHAFRVTREGRPLRAGSGSLGPHAPDASPPSAPSASRVRTRTRRAVRLELDAATPAGLRALLGAALALGEDELQAVAGPLDLGSLTALPGLAPLRAPARVAADRALHPAAPPGAG